MPSRAVITCHVKLISTWSWEHCFLTFICVWFDRERIWGLAPLIPWVFPPYALLTLVTFWEGNSDSFCLCVIKLHVRVGKVDSWHFDMHHSERQEDFRVTHNSRSSFPYASYPTNFYVRSRGCDALEVSMDEWNGSKAAFYSLQNFFSKTGKDKNPDKC